MPVSKALGTIIAERLIDLIVLMSLLLAAGAVVFRTKAPGHPHPVRRDRCGGLPRRRRRHPRDARGPRSASPAPPAGGGLPPLREPPPRHRRTRSRACPRCSGSPCSSGPPRARGSDSSCFSLHLAGVHLGPSQFLLIALVAALLTTVPFLPGGLGLVEAGMIGVLITVGGVTNSAAVSITLLDRSISYGSLVVDRLRDLRASPTCTSPRRTGSQPRGESARHRRRRVHRLAHHRRAHRRRPHR